MKYNKCGWHIITAILVVLTLAACQMGLNSSPTSPAITPVPLPTRTFSDPSTLPTAVPIAAIDLFGRSTEEQLTQVVVPPRDLRDLTVRLNPQIDAVPAIVNSTTPSYTVGDQIKFWVHNVDAITNAQITAELVYKTDVAYVWIETGQTYDLPAIQRSIDRFSQQSYPAEVAFFGSEWYPGVDNDPRVHLLHTVGLGGGIAGYFSSADEYSALARPLSNEKEMFYINLKWVNSLSDYTTYETVLAHEFQHMIHWAHDANEEGWVNEGLSEFAKEVAGYGPETSFVGSFLNQPDTQLNTWSSDTGQNGVHYGSAYLFMHYLNQRFGASVTKPLVANPANGIDGINAALAAAGQAEDFDAVFADWIVANYANDADALGRDGVYGYHKLPLSRPTVAQTVEHIPFAPPPATVHNYATDYVALPDTGDITIQFSGQTTTHLVDTKPYSGRYLWWSNRDDSSASHLTRTFDLRTLEDGALVAMDVAMWWEIETDYDYGYVMASRDGRKWQLLTGQQTTSTNPSGNSFGAGYTGQSPAGWVTESFDLTPYAGEMVQIRFEYITDDATNRSGWLIDDVSIPVLGYATNFEDDVAGWESSGWLLTDNQLTQDWLLQVMEFTGDELTDLRRIPVDAEGNAQFDVDDLGDGRRAVLAISALAPVTTEPATYEFLINQAQE